MDKELKIKIISECLNDGVTLTCKKYNISRTIYYKWLKRYQSQGIEGLNIKEKSFVPNNKTAPLVEQAILDLIKIYPNYGPKALKYLLEELGHNISSSAVFNVLKRNNLTNKTQRVIYSKKREIKLTRGIPPLTELTSGECWVFWITDLGPYQNEGNIYLYTFLDLKSKIACSRLYKEISYDNFEDILTSVALSVATTLNLNLSYLCFFKDSKMLNRYRNIFKTKINNTIKKHGRDIRVNILNKNDDINEINEIKKQYIIGCMSTLLELFIKADSFYSIKIKFQDYMRSYNINQKITFGNEFLSPVEYHYQLTNNRVILPLWAYIDRDY